MDTKSFYFAQTLINGTYNIGDYLEAVEEHITIKHIDFNILKNLNVFLNIETQILTIINGNQELRTIKLGDILLLMAEDHFHKVSNHKCKYHDESLLTHSLMCMLKCIEILPLSMSLYYKTQIAITALFHDVGKMSSKVLIKKDKIAFPFHGEMGSGIMQQLYCVEMNKMFTKVEWETMCRAICTHMCGYHVKDYNSKEAKYKMEMLKFETTDVKQLLYHLSYGDSTAKISSVIEENDILDRREKFIENITGDFNILAITAKNKLNGCIIKLCGQSASGKSTITKLIKNYLQSQNVLEEQIVCIERDLIMCNTSLLSQNPDATIFTVKPRGDIYEELYNNYKEKELSNTVNNIIKNIIKQNTDKIIIVDSVINYYNAAAIYPEESKNMLKIAIHLIRGDLINNTDCERMNSSMEKQIKLFGDRDIRCWVPGERVNLNNLTSMSTNNYISQSLVQPHMCFQYFWSDRYKIGATDIKRMLSQISKLITYNPDLCEHIDSFPSTHEAINYYEKNLYVISHPPVFKNTQWDTHSFMIKYKESNNMFSKRWMRETRGSIFIKINDKTYCIKSMLQRGIECVMKCHRSHKIMNNENSNGTYDKNQRKILKAFINEEPLTTYLSFKNDGSLSGIILYPKSDNLITPIINEVIENCPINKIMKDMASNYGFIPVLCSQGTLTVSKDIIDYYVTAIACGMLGIDIYVIRDMAKTMSPTEVLEQYVCKELLRRLDIFWQSCDVLKDKTMCLSFEAVCGDRRSAWLKKHTELAVSYENSSYKMLGCTFNIGETVGQFRSHFQLGSRCANAQFDEPLFWKVEHTDVVNDMVVAVEDVLCDKLSIDDFYRRYPYHNKHNNVNEIMDYEGFVMYTPVSSPAIGIGIIDQDLDYAKAKTSIYYSCHKYNPDNISYLNSLPSNAEQYMPLIKTIKEFDSGIEEKFSNMFMELNDLFMQCINKDHDLYTLQTNMTDKFKMLRSFDALSKHTQCNIIINVFDGYNDYAIEIFSKYFNIVNKSKYIASFLKKLVMTTMPWTQNVNIKKIVSNDTIMSELFKIINED